MIRLNLLPDVKLEYLRSRRAERVVIAIATLSSLAAGGLLVLLALWVYGVQTVHMALVDDGIKKKNAELVAIKDINKYLTVQNQLKNIDSLHENKLITSRIFDVLPRLNPKDPNGVRINTVTIAADQQNLTLEGETNTFTALQTFRDTMRNTKLAYSDKGADASSERKTEALFSDVSVTSQGLGKDAQGKEVVSFKITATYTTNLFSNSVNFIEVTVPTKETTQSKQDAPVFGEATVEQEGSQQ